MADAAIFDWLCFELEQCTPLDRLESRGTVRLALKQAGLEARTVRPDQLKVVIERVLPCELAARGIEDATPLCAAMAQSCEREAPARADSNAPETPDQVFRRIGGDA